MKLIEHLKKYLVCLLRLIMHEATWSSERTDDTDV